MTILKVIAKNRVLQKLVHSIVISDNKLLHYDLWICILFKH